MTPPEPPPFPRDDHLSAETLHDLRTPLTVIRAQSQMVARWLRRLDHSDGQPVLARLAMVEAMIRQIGDQLDHLDAPHDEAAERRDDPDP